MPYLTRMYLNPRRRQTIRFLRDPQAMHAAVMSAFPPLPGQNRELWRLDFLDHRRELLILSERIPSLEHLQEQAGWSERSWETRDYGQLLSRIQLGQRYSFRLVGNPTHTVTDENGSKRRLAHVSVRNQTSWLLSRAEALGVRFLPLVGAEGGEETALPDVLVSDRETLRFKRGSDTVTLARARFDGALEVTDPERLRHALLAGIGRGKAYGCGLLTLAPLKQA